MKLFIYYSYSGNGDIVASTLEKKGFLVRKVFSKLKLSKILFLAMMKGDFQAGINKKAKLIQYDSDVSNYDEIYIGSPIWNDKLSPATNSILNETDLKNKKLTFILYSGSGKSSKADKKINKLYPNARIIHLKEPKKYLDELKKLEDLYE